MTIKPQPGTSQTIYLDLDDEVTSVIDRLSGVSEQDITLVIPKNAIVLQSAVNLKLLKRAAERLKKNLLVVTRDETGLALALRAGINVRTTLSGKTIDASMIKQSRPSVATIHEMVSEDLAPTKTRQEAQEVRVATYVEMQPDETSTTSKSSSLPQTNEPQRVSPDPDRVRKGATTNVRSAVSVKFEQLKEVASRTFKKKPGANSRTRAVAARASESGSSRIRLLPKVPLKPVIIPAAILLVVAFLGMTFIFASAEVRITPKTQKASIDLEATATAQPAPGTKEITGTIVELAREGKKSVVPSGHTDTGTKATGSVTISNTFSDKPQSFGVNTRLQSAGGQVFLLTAQVTVPGAKINKGKLEAGTASASVVAEKFGEEYNIAPGALTFIDLPPDQQQGITATSAAAMVGGTKKQVKVLASKDVDDAKAAVSGELGPTLLAELKGKLQPEEEILDGASSVETSGVKSSVAIGAELPEGTEQVDVTLTVKVRAVVDRPHEIKSLAAEELKKTLPANQALLEEQEPEVTWAFKSVDFKQQKMIVSVHVEKQSVFTLDSEAIKAQLTGKKESEAREYLSSLPEVAEVKLRLSPVWRSRLPGMGKIELKVTL
jgi:hypothetical protein